MKDKYISIFFIFVIATLLSVGQTNAQITSGAQSTFIPVRTYNGVIQENAFGFRIHINSAVNIPNWSLMIRVNGPIRNSDQKIVDPTKLKIRINYVNGLSMQDIGTNNTPVPLSQAGVAIFRNSKAPLFTTGTNYKQILISFDILVEGGAYLENLKSWQNYFLNTVFSVVNQQGRVVTESPATVEMQIHPDDLPPSGPTYSIQVLGNAADGLLEFNSISDYVNGVSQTYNSGLSVTSSTDYQVQVRTLTSNFQGTSSTIPVNAVKLNLRQVNHIREGTITLSENLQAVINNGAVTGSQAALYNIRYFTQPNDARLLNAKADTYRTTLMYTLIPQ